MRAALNRTVLRALRDAGFAGTHPHYRRTSPGGRAMDLVSFQTDKWGGGFLIETASCPAKDIRDWAGQRVSPRSVTAQHISARRRLPKSITRRDWYRYDDAGDSVRFERVAGHALAHLAKLGLVSPEAPRAASAPQQVRSTTLGTDNTRGGVDVSVSGQGQRCPSDKPTQIRSAK